MAISYVGGKIVGFAGSASSTTIPLTDLTGGSDSAPQSGDLVIVGYAVGLAIAPFPIGVETAGYSEVAELFGDDSRDVLFSVSTKIMEAPADTDVVVSQATTNAHGCAVWVAVWRGVDPSIHDVTHATATGIDSGRPDAPAITPVTPGVIVVVVGAGSAGTGVTTVFSQPGAELSNFNSVVGVATRPGIIGGGSYAWTSGTFDPVGWLGGYNNTNGAWTAVTLALRPAGGGGEDTEDNLTASSLTSAVPTLGTAALGQKHGLSPTSLTSAPAMGTPVVSQIVAISASALTGAVPTLGMPALGVVSALTGLALTGSAPTLASPTVGQKHGLGTVGIAASPQVAVPALGHVYNLAGAGLETAPALGSGALAQSHALGGVSVTSGAVTLGTPVLAAQSGTDTLAADGIASAATLGTPTLGQGHALAGAGLSSAANVGGAALGQSHALAAAGISGSAAVGLPGVGQRHAIAANGIASAASFGAPAVSTEGTDALTADGLAVVASFGAPALGQAHELAGAGIDAGTPAIGSPSLVQNTGLVAAGLASAASLGSPVVGQVHGFAAVAVVGGAPVTGAADFSQVHIIAANDLDGGTASIGQPALFSVGVVTTPESRTAQAGAAGRVAMVVSQDRNIVAGSVERSVSAAASSGIVSPQRVRS